MSLMAAADPGFSVHLALQDDNDWKLLALPLHPLQVNGLQVEAVASKQYLGTSERQGPTDLGREQGKGKLVVVVVVGLVTVAVAVAFTFGFFVGVVVIVAAFTVEVEFFGRRV